MMAMVWIGAHKKSLVSGSGSPCEHGSSKVTLVSLHHHHCLGHHPNVSKHQQILLSPLLKKSHPRALRPARLLSASFLASTRSHFSKRSVSRGTTIKEHPAPSGAAPKILSRPGSPPAARPVQASAC